MQRGRRPAFALKQDEKRKRLWVSLVLFFFVLPGAVALIILLRGMTLREEFVEASITINVNKRISQKSGHDKECRSWCDRDPETWDWAQGHPRNIYKKFGLPELPTWRVGFKDTALKVSKEQMPANVGDIKTCCLSTDAMEGYVHGCRYLGPVGEVRFNDYLYSMIEESIEALPTATRALSLGLGIGGIPQILVELVEKVTVDAVEIDKNVVEVASEAFCFPDKHPRINTITADGISFVKKAEKESYDAVYVDMLEGKELPKASQDAAFFSAVESILKPGGIVVSNTIKKNPEIFRNMDMVIGACEMVDRLVVCQKGGLQR